MLGNRLNNISADVILCVWRPVVRKSKPPHISRFCGPYMKLRMTCVLDDVERNQIM